MRWCRFRNMREDKGLGLIVLGLHHIDALFYVVVLSNNFYILLNCCDFDNMIGLHFLQWWLLYIMLLREILLAKFIIHC